MELKTDGLIVRENNNVGEADRFVQLLTRDEMERSLETAIHQFAKRQMTWFRGMERRGWHITWLPFDMELASFVSEIQKLIENAQS